MRRGVLAAALAWTALACGRLKSEAPDGGPALDGGATAGRGPAAPDGGGPTTPPDSGLTSGSDAGDPGRPLPAGVPAPARFFDARGILNMACTSQTPPSGDGHRWCGVVGGAGPSGLAEIWVVDITRAATGDVPRCDGTDAGCLLLSDEVDPRGLAFFDGDTLIYGTDNVAGPAQDFLGRLFAWRPGWSAGRQISSDAGVTCLGNAHSAAVACLDDPAGDPTKRDSVNVSAGYLLDQTGGAMPSFGRWPLRNDNAIAWQAGFSPDGSVFVLSDADTIGAPRTLRLSPTANVGQASLTIALEDVTEWQISNDGQKIYFIRGLPAEEDLYVADFPTGANTQLLETNIVAFELLGTEPADQGLVIQQSDGANGGIVELSPDRATAPKEIFTYTDVLNGAIVSPDLRYTTRLDDSFRGVAFRNADLATCALNQDSDPPVSVVSYLAGASLMFWKETGPADSSALLDGFYAPPELCGRRRQFATHVDLIEPVGDRGVVFEDQFDPSTGRATLKYIAASADGTTLDPRGAVRIQGEVTAPVLFVGADPPLLVYAAKGATDDATDDASGLFVFGPVPF